MSSWDAYTPKTKERPRSAPRKPVEELATESLMKRAKKRIVTEDSHGDQRYWHVAGDPKLGDTFHHYRVTLPEGARRYECSCYGSNYGDARRAKMCSHVLAVVLLRRGEGGGSGQSQVSGPEPAPTPATKVSEVPETAQSEPRTRKSEVYPTSPQLNPQGWAPPPDWLTEYRPHQEDAIEEVVEQFRHHQIVYLNAPTGSGKTAIADAVARRLRERGLYVCSGLQLQEQFLADYPYARAIKGKNNYLTQHGPAHVTCADCTGTPGKDDCLYCDVQMECPYRIAKGVAVLAQTPVLNSAYWIRECTTQKPAFSRPRGLVVLDECDTLEDVLMGFTAYSLTQTRLRTLGVEAPKPRVHKKTISKWLYEDVTPAITTAINKAKAEIRGLATDGKDTLKARRTLSGLYVLAEDTERVANGLVEDSDNWIRDNGDDRVPLAYKPVTVAPFGHRYIWRHAGKALLMSATIISPDQMNSDLGWDDGYGVVQVPMTFPVENRRIHVAAVSDMSFGNKYEGMEKAAIAISKLMVKHAGERILVHTVSKERSQYFINHHAIKDAASRVNMKLITYTDTASREQSLVKLRGSASGILFAHSFDRGVDLRDDDCRVVIVAKIPFPYLGDPQVSARSHQDPMWYAVRTVRSLVQMTGRGVRSADDWCVSYILDQQFEKNIWRKHRNLLPEWWKEALNRRFKVRELME